MRKKIGIILSIAISLLSLFILIILIIFKNPQNVINLFRKPVVQKIVLPEGFPDIPHYNDATLVASVSEPRGEGQYLSGTWNTDSSVSDVSTWYKNILNDTGWIIDIEPADYKANDIQYLVAFKNGTRLQLSMIKKEDINKVQIIAEFQPIVEDKD